MAELECAVNESEFKRWVRSNWFGWIESYEPRRGTGVGIPDLQLFVAGRLVPCELKVGKIDGDILFVNEIRADQAGWHHRFNKAGGSSIFLIGVGDKQKPERIFVYDAQNVRNWFNGLDLENGCELQTTERKFHNGLFKFCSDLIFYKPMNLSD